MGFSSIERKRFWESFAVKECVFVTTDSWELLLERRCWTLVCGWTRGRWGGMLSIFPWAVCLGGMIHFPTLVSVYVRCWLWFAGCSKDGISIQDDGLSCVFSFSSLVSSAARSRMIVIIVRQVDDLANSDADVSGSITHAEHVSPGISLCRFQVLLLAVLPGNVMSWFWLDLLNIVLNLLSFFVLHSFRCLSSDGLCLSSAS